MFQSQEGTGPDVLWGSPFFKKKEKNVPLQAGVQCNLQRQK